MVEVYETATLTLTHQEDQSEVDEWAGFWYVFDCDTSDAFTNAPINVNHFGCAYASPGNFAATATIIDKDGGSNTYDVIINVKSDEPDVCYAESVESYEPGRRKNGKLLHSKRSNPEKALGAPQDDYSLNYVALGLASEHGSSRLDYSWFRWTMSSRITMEVKTI